MQVWSLGQEDSLEEGMATHSSILAWGISSTEEPGGLQSMGSHRVRHDWSDLAAAAAVVKNLPAMQETQVWSLGQEDSLEKGMATHSNILAWRIPRTEEPGRLQFRGSQRVGHDWGLSGKHFHFNYLYYRLSVRFQLGNLDKVRGCKSP